MPSPPENEATPQSAAFDDAKSSLALLSAATNAVSDLGFILRPARKCVRDGAICGAPLRGEGQIQRKTAL